MSRSVTVAAPAKINLQLGVGPVRADGFHPLATVYQAVDVHDEVTVAEASSTRLEVRGDGVDVSDVPTDGANLVLRAAELLAKHAGLGDASVSVSVRKRIPVAGGLAGGSADAAATLVACDALWGLRTPRADLLRLAGELGSDVPFCVLGGTATGSGRGELVEPLPDAGTYWWVLATSGEGLSTPAVYGTFDRAHAGRTVAEPSLSQALVAALAAGDPVALGAALSNDLQTPALSLRPSLAELLELGAQPPAVGSLLSGSGPTCLFLTADEADAASVRDRLDAAGHRTLTARGPVPGARVVDAL